MELEPAHLTKIEEVITLLDLSDDCTIAFIRCNEPTLCDAIYREILERVHRRIYIYNIVMSEESTNLFQLLEQIIDSSSYTLKINENKKIAFFIFGLDEAIRKKNADGKSEALLLLNMMREKFLEVQHPILIWIDSVSLNLILEEAQDFFSWRTTIFEFEIKRKITPSEVLRFEEFDCLDETGLEELVGKKSLEELVDYYKNLIIEFENKELKDPYKFAYWNYNLGKIQLSIGYLNEAAKYLETAASISSVLNNQNLKGSIYNKLGVTYYELGDLKKAIEYSKQALKIAKGNGNKKDEGLIFKNIGIIYEQLGDRRKAIEYYEKALKISRETRDRNGERNYLGNLGDAFSDLGEPGKAFEYYKQAVKIGKEMVANLEEEIKLGKMGGIYRRIGEHGKAIECFKLALKVSRDVGERLEEEIWLVNLGDVFSDLGETRKAIEHYEQALKISKEMGHKFREGRILVNLGLIYSALGETRKAIEYYVHALEISQEIGDRFREGKILVNLGLAYNDLGEPRKAIEFLKESIAIGKAIEDPRIISFSKQKLKDLKESEE